MSCDACDHELNELTGFYPYRIGNATVGYGNVALVGCRAHVKLALDRLNNKEEA